MVFLTPVKAVSEGPTACLLLVVQASISNSLGNFQHETFVSRDILAVSSCQSCCLTSA